MRRDDLPAAAEQDRGVLRFLTCGSVDDGKSTLIGRLLYDTKALLSDTLATLERHASRRGLSAPDLSLLTDGLVAEREQGITIDVAYRYFATARRKFIIADAPGHEQYTRNMVTAASTADAAVLLVDARQGVLPQTRRHATIAATLGIRQLVLAVNKMDLVDWSRERYEAIVADFRDWIGRHPELAGETVQALPLSALEGDGVVERGAHMPWYDGPTLVEWLERAPATQRPVDAPLRFPVQWVCRPAQRDAADVRAYAGRVESGRVSVGDAVRVEPGGAVARVLRIALGEATLSEAVAGQSVMLHLDTERDIARGDLLVAAADAVTPCRRFDATLCWLNTAPLSPVRTYLLRHGASEVRARIAQVEARLDLATLVWQPAHGTPVGVNELARVALEVQQPLLLDDYARLRGTGSFVLVDPASFETIAGGLVQREPAGAGR